MGSIQENQNVPLSARHFFKRLWIVCTITFTTKLIDISRLWDLNEKKVEELLCLLVFGVLQVKDGLDRTDMYKDKLKQQNFHTLECGLGHTFWI